MCTITAICYTYVIPKDKMKQYLLYLISGLVVSWFLLFLWGFSAGPASVYPYFILIGSFTLFLVASSVSLFSQKVGAVFGIPCLLILLPWVIELNIEYLTPFDWTGTVFTIPPLLLVLISIYYSVRHSILNKELTWDVDKKVKPSIQFSLLAIPLLLIVYWIYSISGNFL